MFFGCEYTHNVLSFMSHVGVVFFLDVRLYEKQSIKPKNTKACLLDLARLVDVVYLAIWLAPWLNLASMVGTHLQVTCKGK